MHIARLLRFANAEFCRIGGSRSYWIYHVGVLFVVLLFAADLFLLARPAQIPPGAGMSGYPWLFVLIWERMLPLGLVICTSVFWAAADSQHGMIRVVATQPLSRTDYVVGKQLAIGGHAVCFALSVAFSEVIACLVLGGTGGVTRATTTAVAASTCEAIAVMLLFVVLSTSMGLVRRTIGSGLVAMLVVFTVFGITWSAASDTVREYLPPRYVMLPFRGLADVLPSGAYSFTRLLNDALDASFWRLAITALATCVLSIGAAALHAHYRDISE